MRRKGYDTPSCLSLAFLIYEGQLLMLGHVLCRTRCVSVDYGPYTPIHQSSEPKRPRSSPEVSRNRCCVSYSTCMSDRGSSLSASRYEVLSDPETRDLYDQVGLEGMTRGAGGGPPGADIFNQFFSGGGFNFGFDFGPGRRPGRGEDSVIPYEVTLEDLYNGKTVKMDMEKEVVCSTCKGCDRADALYCLNLMLINPGRAGREAPNRRNARFVKETVTRWLGSR
jgi:hypothetical protein